MEENKPGAVQVEQVNHTLDPLTNDHEVAEVVVEGQLFEGINLETILAFLVRSQYFQRSFFSS